MKDIDQLQNSVEALWEQRAAGNPASDEQGKIKKALEGLKALYDTYSKKNPKVRGGVPVDSKHVDFLESYAFNALQQAISVALRINPPGQEAPPITLPPHVELLDATDRESFKDKLDFLNDILQGKASPMDLDHVHMLLELSFELGKLNSKCADKLNAMTDSPAFKNNPAQILRRQQDIDVFQAALEHAVNGAIGSQAPMPAETQRASSLEQISGASPPKQLQRMQTWLNATDFGFDPEGNRLPASAPASSGREAGDNDDISSISSHSGKDAVSDIYSDSLPARSAKADKDAAKPFLDAAKFPHIAFLENPDDRKKFADLLIKLGGVAVKCAKTALTEMDWKSATLDIDTAKALNDKCHKHAPKNLVQDILATAKILQSVADAVQRNKKVFSRIRSLVR